MAAEKVSIVDPAFQEQTAGGLLLEAAFLGAA